MAELLITECIQKTRVIHRISCDKCGKHICDSVEYDDGYYNDPSKYEQTICINSTWYKLRGNLCEECAAEKTEELIKMLNDFGFKKDRY